MSKLLEMLSKAAEEAVDAAQANPEMKPDMLYQEPVRQAKPISPLRPISLAQPKPKVTESITCAALPPIQMRPDKPSHAPVPSIVTARSNPVSSVDLSQNKDIQDFFNKVEQLDDFDASSSESMLQINEDDIVDVTDDALSEDGFSLIDGPSFSLSEDSSFNIDIDVDESLAEDLVSSPEITALGSASSTNEVHPNADAILTFVNTLKTKISNLEKKQTESEALIELLKKQLDDANAALEVANTRASDAVAQLNDAAKRYATLHGQATQLQEKLVRASADFDNYRKRVARDQAQLKEQMQEKVVADFLNVMDNLERAIQHAQVSNNFDNLLHGVELTAKIFSQSLAKQTCQAFDSIGKAFDPNFHDVLSRVESAEAPHNTIVQEHLKGYMMHDRLLRPALVVVSQQPEVPAVPPDPAPSVEEQPVENESTAEAENEELIKE